MSKFKNVSYRYQINLIPITQIKVANRTREELGEIGDLMNSIKSLGLLSPLIIDKDNNLLAGGRRLAALKGLKWEEVPCLYFDQLTEIEKLEIELHENIKRKDLSWQEEVLLRQKINDMKKKEDPSLTMPKISQLTNTTERTLRDSLVLARALKRYPEIAKEKDRANALRKVRRMEEKAVRELMVEAGGSPTVDKITGLKNFQIEGVTLVNGDCVEGIKGIPDESIDLLITDFPFGVDLDKNYDFQKSWAEVYKDGATDLLEHLLPRLVPEFHRVLKPGAHFYIFFPSLYYEEFFDELDEVMNLQKIPLIWNKKHGGTSFAPYSIYTPNYEPIWYGSKGKGRKLAKPGYCVLDFPNIAGGKKTHPAEKPWQLIDYLITQSSIKGETVLDVFSGSGVTMERCLEFGRKGIAFELSETWFNLGVERLKNFFQLTKTHSLEE